MRQNKIAADVVQRILTCIFLFFLSVSSAFAGEREQRNYMDPQNAEINSSVSNIVWRAKPTIKVYGQNQSEREFDLSEVHKRLKNLTQEDREKLDGETIKNIVERNPVTARNGNCACACLSIIYSDDQIYNASLDHLETIPPKINQTALPTDFTLNGFTTVKAKKNIGRSESVFITRPQETNAARELVKKDNNSGYSDSELQIVSTLFFPKNRPFFDEFLKKFKEKYSDKPISLIVLNIYTELDPCGWCGPMLVKLSEKINLKKPWLKHFQKQLDEINSEFQKLKSSYDDQIEKLQPHADGKDLSSCSNDDLDGIIQAELTERRKKEQESQFPSLNSPSPLDFVKVRQKYLEKEREKECAEKNLFSSQSARFMVIISSSQPCHRSREIGLDPVFMDPELSKLPMVINLSNQTLDLESEWGLIPQDFVIFIPAEDVIDFPLIRVKTSLGEFLSNFLHTRNNPSDSSSSLKQSLTIPSLPIRGLSRNEEAQICYFNSAMQALASLTIFQNIENKFNSNNVSHFVSTLVQEIRGAGKEINGNTKWGEIVPKIRSDWNTGQQQDVHEFLNALIDKLVSENSIIKNAFTGKITTHIQCNNKHDKEKKEEQFTTIQLPIISRDGNTAYNDLEACLTAYQESETMSGDNKLECEKCNGKVEAIKTVTLSDLPSVLMIQLGRFKHIQETSSYQKLNKTITYAENLDISGKKYSLKAVINHIGKSLEKGHYTATVLGADTKWYKVNDSTVTETVFSVSPDAYILLYEAAPQ